MNIDDKTKDWDTENFTEIDLTAQKVYVWRNGKVAFKCRTISGKPVKDRQTRTGAYFIKEHQTLRTLRGDNYATPVNNWVVSCGPEPDSTVRLGSHGAAGVKHFIEAVVHTDA